MRSMAPVPTSGHFVRNRTHPAHRASANPNGTAAFRPAYLVTELLVHD
jgi:hypothetical protein